MRLMDRRGQSPGHARPCPEAVMSSQLRLAWPAVSSRGSALTVEKYERPPRGGRSRAGPVHESGTPPREPCRRIEKPAAAPRCGRARFD
jgi:hypothetical protein